MPTIRSIVLTGGPCAGKSTAMSWLQNDLHKKGWRVLFVPETATELISGGVAPWTCASNDVYQGFQFELQLAKEDIFARAAAGMDAEKVLIVCDRGLLDNKAYMTPSEFEAVLGRTGLGLAEARDRYDAVFHLVTAAKGAVEFYTCANNGARTETPEQAAALDDRLIDAWTGHAHLRVVGNEGSFEDKMRHLLGEVTSFLGEPEPYQVERKFLAARPSDEELAAIPVCERVEILQTYLSTSEPDVEVRVRQRGVGGSYAYTKTVKRPGPSGDPATRVELEERLTGDQYLRLLMEADPALRPIRKTRYCFMYGDRYFKLDVYPDLPQNALLEVELLSADEAFELPAFLAAEREVTGDPAWRNRALAERVAGLE